jgi:tetratricopeptide (TPR) repeat protein
MGLFDFIFGSTAPHIQDADQLLATLIETVRAGDLKKLERICRANRETVIQNFPAWQKVPEDVRQDPEKLNRYVPALITVAQLFDSRFGAPELLNALIGNEESNILIRWQNELAQASQMMNELRYADASELLTNLLIDVRGNQGTGPDKYLPITLGSLGVCYFQSRQAEKAIPDLEQALEHCERSGDNEGVKTYLSNLYEAHRYLAQVEAAAECAVRLAEVLEKDGQLTDAVHYRRQAKIVRAGEPLNRIIAVVDGIRYEVDEVNPVEGKKIQFVYERNRIRLHPAVELTRRGEELGKQGRNEEALNQFRDAAKADPFDPHCRYLEGFALLHLQRYIQAVESYQVTEEFAPGWFHCRSDLWLAQQMALGNIGHELFLSLVALEDGSEPPAEKISLADVALQRYPMVAHLYLYRGKSLLPLGREQDAQAAFRAGLEYADEPDVKTRLLVELAVLLEDGEERAELLREAQALNGNLMAGAVATLALKKMGVV